MFAVALTGSLCTASHAEQTTARFAWVQYAESGVEARAVVSGGCPDIELDGRIVPMQLRAKPQVQFPDSVCSRPVPPGITTIRLGEQSLPVPVKATPQRIAVIGDTGCRVSAKHGLYQACNNNSLWPFEKVAQSVARYRPEIIIHTGDYIYRESPCPEQNRGCAGTPFGDNQATWQADWFVPSRALAMAAPLVLVRGNHESCSRAGLGWFRYLDGRRWSGQCEPNTEPWLVEAGVMRLVNLDSSQLKGQDNQPLLDMFAAQMSRVNSLLDGPGWLLSHRPLWGFGANDDSGKPIEETRVLQQAVRRSGLSADVQMVVSAHIHLAELLDFDGARPDQLIVGNGGTELVPETPVPATIDGLPIRLHRTFYQYGFVTLDGIFGELLEIDFLDRQGRPMASCRQVGEKVSC